MNRLLRVKKALALSASMMLTLGILLSTAGSVVSQDSSVAAGTIVGAAPSQRLGPTDPAELEAFLDKLLRTEMEEYHIAGAAVAVVKNGEILLAKGYGYADVDKGIPVDPEQTIFSIGSNGKVFTWTAVMQLVEQGKLDLDADINTYLDFRIPDTYPQPVTLRHLMTHTSGFEDRWFTGGETNADKLLPVREFLVSDIWARVRPPGDAGYSNYNPVLAGYIVARVSGQPYEQYIQENILRPLGMAHSAARYPVPPDLRAYASKGYTYQDGGFRAFTEYVGQPAGAPSGSHQASIADMARFLIAHLEGSGGDADSAERRILKASTLRQMHTTLYAPDPRLNGTAYGLFDMSENGQRTLGHSGYLPPMHSLLLLLLDQNLGVFVVYNSEGGGALTNQHSGFQKAFFDHYFPSSRPTPLQPPADFAERADRFVGLYNASSRYTTISKLTGLGGGGFTTEISNPGDGTLLYNLMGDKRRFVEVEPLYFRQVDAPFGIVFREDDRGRITHIYTDIVPQYAVARLRWYETPGFSMMFVQACLLIFLSVLPAGLIRVVRDRRRGGDRPLAPRGARVFPWMLIGISILNLVFMVAFQLGQNQVTYNVLLAPPLFFQILLGLGVLSAVLTAGALLFIVLAWMNRYWGTTARVYYTLVTVAAVAFVWFLNYWNLLGWRF